ncbi:hypothetical protein LMH87_004208 [Akanthomyces muscarius]|uniref:Nephrocystin 3-like N-terminal domain-containing protein n=1 Tax=Akanthomyces muscarius TaxID=2231603 RepID=A0A9W8Q3B6_AKAMU|nr:hypothetical protein LMH87_004208 [Akanthomyces muscarius]KAJ4145355.1 hypothetical protein LMH87_004208 [Akanthomyces muscarius]
MDMLPFRVSSDPEARGTLEAFGPGNATLGISLQLVEPGTNRWIFADEHVNAWLSGQPDAGWVAPGQDATLQTMRKLWLYGPSGSGRTLLAATLAHHLLQRLPSETEHAVCYYFAGDGGTENEAVACLRTLVAQLAQQSEAAYDDFHKSVKFGALPSGCDFTNGGVRLFNAEYAVDLGHLLEAMSRHFSKVSLVVRGIDYMAAALALQLTAMADAPSSSIRTVFTSGDGDGQQDACMQTVSCPVEVMAAQEEVRLYVRSEMERRIDKGDIFLGIDQPRKEIEEYILGNNHGSWLWAVTTLDDQCDLLRRNLWVPLTTRADVHGESQIPDTSKPAFDPYLERILRDNDSMPKFVLTRTAHWLAMAENEPTFRLTADEHLKALTVLYGTTNEEFRTSRRTIHAQDVIHACRPIVRLTHVAGISTFQFKHKTVYAYLIHILPSYNMPLKDISYDGYIMGREFKDFVTICNALARHDAGCAESLFQKLLSAQRKLFGPDDADTLFTQEHFASFCWDQGRLEEAERLYLDIVRGYERAPPDIIDPQHNVLNNLGIFYKRQGRYAEAEHYYQAALRGREACHGAAHESTLHTVGNMAQMYAAQGNAAAAQGQWAKALPLCEGTFGRHHATTLSTVYNLGLTHKSLGEHDAAEALLARALAEHEQVYGPEDGSTLDVVTSLAHLHLLRDSDVAAEALYSRALTSYEKLQGPNGENVLRTCHSLAKAYHALERMQDAERMAKRALHGFEATVGPDSIDAVDVAYTLFLGYIEEERLRDAVVLGERVLAGFETARDDGDGREGIAASVADNMALAHAKLGELAPAEALWQRAYQGHVQARGERDELSLAVANNLGLLHMRQERVEEAQRWLKCAFEGYEGLQGTEGEMARRIARDLASVEREMKVRAGDSTAGLGRQ